MQVAMFLNLSFFKPDAWWNGFAAYALLLLLLYSWLSNASTVDIMSYIAQIDSREFLLDR